MAVVSAIDLNEDEDEVCAAQLRYADRHHKGLTERGSSAQETFTSDLFFVVVSLLFAKNIEQEPEIKANKSVSYVY